MSAPLKVTLFLERNYGFNLINPTRMLKWKMNPPPQPRPSSSCPPPIPFDTHVYTRAQTQIGNIVKKLRSGFECDPCKWGAGGKVNDIKSSSERFSELVRCLGWPGLGSRFQRFPFSQRWLTWQVWGESRPLLLPNRPLQPAGITAGQHGQLITAVTELEAGLFEGAAIIRTNMLSLKYLDLLVPHCLLAKFALFVRAIKLTFHDEPWPSPQQRGIGKMLFYRHSK